MNEKKMGCRKCDACVRVLRRKNSAFVFVNFLIFGTWFIKKNLACWIFLLNYLHLRDSHGKINFTVEQFSANTRCWASHFLKFVLQRAQTTHFAYHLAKSKHSREPFSLSIAVFHYLLFSSSSPLSTLFLCARSLFEIE